MTELTRWEREGGATALAPPFWLLSAKRKAWRDYVPPNLPLGG